METLSRAGGAAREPSQANDGKRSGGNGGRRTEEPAPRPIKSQAEIVSYGTLLLPLIDSK